MNKSIFGDKMVNDTTTFISSGSEGIGRLKFFFLLALVQIVSAIAFRILYQGVLSSQPGSSFLERADGFIFAQLVYSALLSALVEKRLHNMGIINKTSLAFGMFLVSFVLGVWLLAAFDNNPAGTLFPQTISMLFGIPCFIILLLYPSRDSAHKIRTQLQLKILQRKLKYEKDRIAREEEIEKIRTEIEQIKNKN